MIVLIEILDLCVLEVFIPSSSSWEVYTDGAVNQKGSGVGIVLVTPEKLVVGKSLRLGFLTTNNETEYEALLVGMEMVSRLGREVLEIYSDSHLVVRQVNGEFEARNQRMQGYLFKVKCARYSFKIFIL